MRPQRSIETTLGQYKLHAGRPDVGRHPDPFVDRHRYPAVDDTQASERQPSVVEAAIPVEQRPRRWRRLIPVALAEERSHVQDRRAEAAVDPRPSSIQGDVEFTAEAAFASGADQFPQFDTTRR